MRSSAKDTRERGLTLVEMLIVLTIIGVMAGAVTLSLGSSGASRDAAAEARRLATRLTLAADETMVTDRPIALEWDARGYRFVTWNAAKAKWLPATSDTLGNRHDLPRGLTLASDGTGSPLPIGDAADQAAPFTIGASTITFDGMAAKVQAR